MVPGSRSSRTPCTPRPAGSILRYRLRPRSWRRVPRPTRSSADFPVEGGHPMHPFTIDPEGNLFMNSGSSTNACQVEDRQPGSLGERPCKELATRAGIWRFSATKTGQRFSRGRALRHRHPQRGQPGGQSGRRRALRHPAWARSAGGELAQAFRLEAERGAAGRGAAAGREGGDYGWPYCYYDPEGREAGAGPGIRRRRQEGRGVRARSSGRQRRSRRTGRPTAWPSTPAKRFPRPTMAAHSSPSTARGTAPRSRRRDTTSCSSRSPAASRPGDYQVFADGFAGTQQAARHGEASALGGRGRAGRRPLHQRRQRRAGLAGGARGTVAG